MYKRYEMYTREGKVWSKWFQVSENCIKEPWQLKNKLKNEYKSEL